MFVSYDSLGRIAASSDYHFEGSEWTDREVVRGNGGILCFADEFQPDNEREWAGQIRAERNRRLAEFDFAMLPDAPIDEDVRSRIAAYRQALRDLPEQDGFPWRGWLPSADDIESNALVPWPQKPEE